MDISRQQLQDLMDNSNAVFFIKDLDGKYLFINKQGEQVFHVTREKIIGLNDYDVWSKELAKNFRAKDKEVLETGKAISYEYNSPPEDGSRTYIVLKFPMRDSQDVTYALCGIGTDVTELKSANEKISKLNVDLRKINQDLDSFIYAASHQLKHPISNVEGLIEMMKDPEFNDLEARVKLLEMMENAVEKFKKTIGLLEDISKIQREHDRESRNINLYDLTEKIISDLKDEIDNSGVIIIRDFKECETVSYSEENLTTVLFNLLDNAIQFRDPKRRLVVDIKSWKSEDDYAVLSVKDNGIGFDLDIKEKIFSMFKKMHSHSEGMGVGLYIVKRILDNSDGKIEVESEVGKGSEFTVFLKQ